MCCSQRAGAALREWGGNRVEHSERNLGVGTSCPSCAPAGVPGVPKPALGAVATCMALRYTVVDTANWAQGSWDFGGRSPVVILIVLPDLLIRWSCPSSSP